MNSVRPAVCTEEVMKTHEPHVRAKEGPALCVGYFISAASDASETLYTKRLVTVGVKKQEVMSQPSLRGARTVIE